MNIPVIAFFNNKGGVGKTSLVYHLAWMYSDMGISVIAADLDPQANLTAAFLSEARLEQLYESQPDGTIFGCVKPLFRGVGDIVQPHPVRISDNLTLLAGDLELSAFEDELSQQWSACLDRKERAFRVLSAFYRAMQTMAEEKKARLVLVDLGPNLGAVNRATLISADYVVIPLSPDLFSLKGLENLGPALRRWRQEWNERLGKNPVSDLLLPPGSITPLGYIVLQHSIRLDRPVKAYEKWIARIPEVYAKMVLDRAVSVGVTIEDDPECLSLLKHYRSLMPMAQEANKPIFHLKPADGAIGAHVYAVNSCYVDFEFLANKILERASIQP
ncbi:MAG: AAA family ATPase [Planctomycetota bacterium]